ncbi:MAG: hypothetical protein VX272_00380 [Planctomycetota bacterium]|nr:hypothetical protein [Planctomycetota bacterium]
MDPEPEKDPGLKLADPLLGKIESLADFPQGQLFAEGQDNDQPLLAAEAPREELGNLLLFERGLVINPVLVIES